MDVVTSPVRTCTVYCACPYREHLRMVRAGDSETKEARYKTVKRSFGSHIRGRFTPRHKWIGVRDSMGIGDDLNLDATFQQPEDEEDVWYQKDKLYKEHIQEVLDKWTQIDDEIWAKVIVLERNRRVAKAYARAPVLTVNGSDDGFDGFRIGLCGFENPMRDQKTEEFKRHIGHGVKIKMDDAGNILIKRVSKCNVYVKNTGQDDENAIGNEILKLPGCALEPEKPVKLFDMKKFQSNVNRELRRAYPDRRRLECQCLSAIAFVKSEPDVLECPIWVLIINVVAMDMLKSKLPPVQRVMDIKNRPRIPIPDEDPYSVAGNGGGSSGSSGFGTGNPSNAAGSSIVAATREQLLMQTQQLAQRRSEKPPKLPPRENLYPHDIPKPDYDDIDDDTTRLKPFPSSRSKNKTKDNKKYDDPYYCGLRARVPNFVKSKTKEPVPSKRFSMSQQQSPLPLALQHHLHQQQMHQAALQHQHHAALQHQQQHQLQQQPHAIWHARSYESGIDSDALDSPYNQIYGRVPIPTRGYIPNQSRTMYIGEWD
ncbi:expansion [Carabus blaptoides fortunei]